MTEDSSLVNMLQSVVPIRQLNHQTYWYSPDTTTRRDSVCAPLDQPHLIILATWMNAQPRHIVKFVAYYAVTYPETPILLLTSSTASFFLNTSRRQRADFDPAIKAILGRIDAKNKENSILVHALSNGGGGQIAFLSKLYSELQCRPLPAKAIILDSLPGKARFLQGLATFSHDLPKLWLLRVPLQLVFGILLFTFYILPEAFGIKSLALQLRDCLNSTDYLPRNAHRCYIYSTADEFILAADIEQHAGEARTKGLHVDTVCFRESGHVQHMREDPDTYWRAVRETWEK
jgi:hypothetical protein